MAKIIPRIFRIMDTSAVTARTLQGMAHVRSGQAPAWPLVSDRSVRRGSRVKRDFACTSTDAFPSVLVVLRVQSRLRLEGRTRTLSGPSPDLSPARALAPSVRCDPASVRYRCCVSVCVERLGAQMAKERRSLQDLIRSRQQSGFVGRQGQVVQYQENLGFPVDDERRRFLFNIHGDAGVGKTYPD